MNNSNHYDTITEAWQYMLGEHFHWGYFLNDTKNLHQATVNLIELMLSKISVNEKSKIIDIGCGIGSSAIYLNESFNCFVAGISNSPKGIVQANKNIDLKKLNRNISFFVRDALDNKFEDNTFDVAWLLEMSHLIQNKNRLIEETVRVLKHGGQIVLCDLMFKRQPSALEITAHKPDLIKLEAVFGQARIETFNSYMDYFERNNLHNIEIIDISEQVKLTPIFWKENVIKNLNQIIKYIPKKSIDDFIYSCDLLSKFYNEDIWGYGIIKGIK